MDAPLEPAGTAAPSKRNPVLKYSVICPICGASSLQYDLNTRMFWNSAQDVDLQPRDYQCMKGLEQYHPPLYYMWHCPECHYSASHRHFSDPVKDIHIRLDIIQQKVRDANQSSPNFGAVNNLLGSVVDLINPDFFQAIKLHLLGIHFYELIITFLKQNFIILARYYLHLGWIFRDLKDRPPLLAQAQPRLQELFARLKEFWPEAPDSEEAALRKALDYYSLTLDDSRSMKSPVDEVNIIQLMARIHYKLGELRRSQVLLMNSIERAGKARIGLDQQLKASGPNIKPLSPVESGELISQSRKLETLIGDAQVLLDDIKDKTLDEQLQQAQTLIAELPRKEPENIREALQRAKIDPRIIARLLPEPPKKKGLFGFLG